MERRKPRREESGEEARGSGRGCGSPGMKTSRGTAMPKMKTATTKYTPSRPARAPGERSPGGERAMRCLKSASCPECSSVAISEYSPGVDREA